MSKILSLKEVKNADGDLFIDLSPLCYQDQTGIGSYSFIYAIDGKEFLTIKEFDYYPAIFKLKDYKYDIYDDCTIYVDVIDLISGKAKIFGVEVFNKFPFMRNKETNDCENAFMKIDFFGYKFKLEKLSNQSVYRPSKKLYFCLDFTIYDNYIFSILHISYNSCHEEIAYDEIYNLDNLNLLYKRREYTDEMFLLEHVLFVSDDINKVRDKLKKAILLR